MLEADFALFNVGQLVTSAPNCVPAASGDLGLIRRAALASREGKIVWVGPMSGFHDSVSLLPNAEVLNTHGRTVLPGFVDAHTHPVFAGNRIGDFYARSAGHRYEDQIESGIMQTVRATRAATEDELLALAFSRAETFLRLGTTTIEAKTGYGLTLESEMRSLRVLARLQHLQPLKIVPAFLGAHVVPSDFEGSAGEYVAELTSEWLPAAVGSAPICDVWCDTGAFSESQCRTVLAGARDLGFGLTLHASEMGPSAGIRLANEFNALSVDHTVYLSDEDITLLQNSQTVVVLLPGTTFFLGSDTYAPARRLLGAGVTVAISTDFNPGTSHQQNMQFILTLAVVKLGMTAEQAILAATTGGASAIGMSDRVGSLEPGKYCDFAVYRTDDYRAIPYHCANNLIESVVVNGRVVVSEGAIVTPPVNEMRSA